MMVYNKKKVETIFGQHQNFGPKCDEIGYKGNRYRLSGIRVDMTTEYIRIPDGGESRGSNNFFLGRQGYIKIAQERLTYKLTKEIVCKIDRMTDVTIIPKRLV